MVIALTARNLPAKQRRKAVLWGTFGAIILRVVAAVYATILIRHSYVAIGGGLLLLWIAHRLVSDKHGGHSVSGVARQGATVFYAVRTIIIADAVMSIDNILAIAGAARGELVLVGLGLLLSIPIIMWGSLLILRFIERHSWLVWVGGGLLGYTAAALILHGAEGAEWALPNSAWVATLLQFCAAGFFIAEGFVMARRKRRAPAAEQYRNRTRE